MSKRKTKKDVSAIKETKETKTDVKSKTTEEQGSESVTLTIADLQAQSRIFQLASTRGAFHANELSVVGGVFDKLNGFLKQVDEAQKAAGEDKTADKDNENAEDITGNETVADETAIEGA